MAGLPPKKNSDGGEKNSGDLRESPFSHLLAAGGGADLLHVMQCPYDSLHSVRIQRNVPAEEQMREHLKTCKEFLKFQAWERQNNDLENTAEKFVSKSESGDLTPTVSEKLSRGKEGKKKANDGTDELVWDTRKLSIATNAQEMTKAQRKKQSAESRKALTIEKEDRLPPIGDPRYGYGHDGHARDQDGNDGVGDQGGAAGISDMFLWL